MTALLIGLLNPAVLSLGSEPNEPAELSRNSLKNPDTAKARSLRAPSPECKKTETIIRFEKPETEGAVGLEFATAKSQPLTQKLTRNAEVSYNLNRYAHVSSRVAGVVVEMRKDLGAEVVAGEILSVVDSVELGAAKAKVLQAAEQLRLAERNYQREQDLFKQKINPERELHEAETRLAESRIDMAQARQTLRNYGLKDEQINKVADKGDTSSSLEVTAPFDGIVVERSAVMGEITASGQSLLTIADTRRMWAMIDLQTVDLATVRVGQKVTVTVDGLAGETFGGELTWICTHLDPKTRTIRARAELENRDRLLLGSMFGQAHIQTRAGQPATLIPKDAVQWDGCCNMVFVKANGEPGAYQPRKVRLGYGLDGQYEVLAGVQPGDVLVTVGSYLLKTEVLKDSIGAGCCDAAVEELTK